MKESGASQGQPASELISKRIAELGDWRGKPQQNAQAHQRSRPGRRRGVEVDGHSDLVARRHHLHWRILIECREAHLLQGRVSEGSGPSLNSSLDGNTRRAIDIHEERKLTSPPSRRSSPAVALNSSGSRNLQESKS